MKDTSNRLKMKTFEVEILVVPPIADVMLLGAKSYRQVVKIEGYPLKDAKNRTGIK